MKDSSRLQLRNEEITYVLEGGWEYGIGHVEAVDVGFVDPALHLVGDLGRGADDCGAQSCVAKVR